jgi:hypothetical protein
LWLVTKQPNRFSLLSHSWRKRAAAWREWMITEVNSKQTTFD